LILLNPGSSSVIATTGLKLHLKHQLTLSLLAKVLDPTWRAAAVE